jgi:hypothetical protein
MPDATLAQIRTAILEQVPRHLLWRLADAFQRYQSSTNADDEYVTLSDLLALLDTLAEASCLKQP